jgi:Family of unknown function (DUF6166)
MIDLTAPGAVSEIVSKLTVAGLYVGVRLGSDCVVHADSRRLLPGPSQLVWNHSPTGFEWGYGGSGPAQLALALLLDTGLPAELATRLHQHFKFAKVGAWDQRHNWLLPGKHFLDWIEAALTDLAKKDIALPDVAAEPVAGDAEPVAGEQPTLPDPPESSGGSGPAAGRPGARRPRRPLND